MCLWSTALCYDIKINDIHLSKFALVSAMPLIVILDKWDQTELYQNCGMVRILKFLLALVYVLVTMPTKCFPS